MSTSGYWARKMVSRRQALRGAAVGGTGLAALSLIGCGDDDAGGGGASSGTAEVLDWTKGIQGGTLRLQANQFAANFNLIRGENQRAAGITHSTILAYKAGKSGVSTTSLDLEPDAVQAMPEQPDQQSMVFKLKSGVKFHNGRSVTSEDVKYSLDAFASDQSTYKQPMAWYERTETPDPQTFVVKTKRPFADAVRSIGTINHPFILAKEHQEAGNFEALMGSGPYIFESAQAPVTYTFRRNPDYFDKPYPYFDRIVFHVISDDAKRVSDLISKQVDYSYQNLPEITPQIKQGRPDMRHWVFNFNGQRMWMKTDRAPYNDKRIRQALSRSINRKRITEAVYSGEGESDQNFSIMFNDAYGFKKPSQLKSAAQWDYNIAEAKRLLSAAGVNQVDDIINHQVGAVNQNQIDTITLMIADWKENGIGNVRSNPVTPNIVFQQQHEKGFYDGFGYRHNTQNPVLGSFWHARLWSPPEGITPPTDNVSFINNPTLNRLLERQLTEFNHQERMAMFAEMAEIMGDEQYLLHLVTVQHNWFVDPVVKNVEIFFFSVLSTATYLKYYWFDRS